MKTKKAKIKGKKKIETIIKRGEIYIKLIQYGTKREEEHQRSRTGIWYNEQRGKERSYGNTGISFPSCIYDHIAIYGLHCIMSVSTVFS